MISAFRSRIRPAVAGRQGLPAASAPGGLGRLRDDWGTPRSAPAAQRWLADALIAVVVTGVSLAWSYGAQSLPGHHYVMNAAGYLILTVGGLSLTARRRYPASVLAVTLVAALLAAEEDIEVVGEATDGLAAMGLVARTRPDVILMDIRMPDLDGIEATRQIAANPDLAQVHVIILTTFELDEYIFEALRAGAAGFLVKDTGAAELLRAIRVVAGGEALLSPGVTRRLIGEFAARTVQPRAVPGLDDLTPREREVVALIASGLSNEDIAGQLHVSRSTAKTHATRAMMKLGAHDRAQLVVFAYQAGLARPGWVG